MRLCFFLCRRVCPACNGNFTTDARDEQTGSQQKSVAILCGPAQLRVTRKAIKASVGVAGWGRAGERGRGRTDGLFLAALGTQRVGR